MFHSLNLHKHGVELCTLMLTSYSCVTAILRQEDKLSDSLLVAAATAAEADNRANLVTVRAVLFRSHLCEPWGFGLGLSSANAVLITDLVLGGLADGQLQVSGRMS